MTPKISIIIPAHNSADTIEETLLSVLKQSFNDWEAIVVDDGSADKTGEIAACYSAKDRRIRYIKQEKSGVSAARNKGIENAANDWLLFLDSDDLIKPDMLEKMIKGAGLHPECDLILCDWERLTVDGRTIKEVSPEWAEVDAFNLFASTCAFCIHSCLVKKSAVLNAGKFDRSLTTCEDWDLWQRIARTGAKFTLVPHSLAVYRMRSESASNKGIQLFKDGLIVTARGHSKDPRVPNADEKYINGAPAEDLHDVICGLFTWSAGLIFGSGGDPSALLEHLPRNEKIFFDIPAFTGDFFKAAVLPTGSSFEVWEQLYNNHFDLLKSFLQKLELLTSTPEFVKRSLISLERSFFNQTDLSEPKRLGSSFGISVDITRPVNHIKTESCIERVIIKIKAKEKIYGSIELPAVKGFIHKLVIKDAVAENYSWQILGEFFKKSVYNHLGFFKKCALKIRSIQYKQDIRKNSPDYFEKLHDFIGWTIFLQELFDKPFWISSRFYLPRRELKFVRTLKQEHEDIPIELGNEIPNIKTAKSKAFLVITAGGNACSEMEIPAGKKFLSSQEIRSRIIIELGYELCKIVVREILLEEDIKEKISLNKLIRNKLQNAPDKHSKENPLYYNFSNEIKRTAADHQRQAVIPHRKSIFPDDSSARFAMLPVSGNLNGPRFFKAPDEQNVFLVNDGNKEVLSDAEAFDSALYSPNIIITRQSHHSPAEMQIPPADFQRKNPVKSKGHTRDLPVLMYHRIAPSGSDLMKEYRIAPELFEKQIMYLYANGFYSVSFEEWYSLAKLNKPLPGKALILSFDDGYLDFYQYAYPVLKKYKFSAYVYIVTDCVGQFNVWDQALGEKLPLMNWKQIAELDKEGIKFGSHTSSHKPLTALNSEQLACQFLNSLNTLREHLGPQINSIAYPYGDYDAVVKHLAGGCGYAFGLTCDDGKCNKYSDLLALPRIEISGLDSFENFIQKVENIPIYPG